MTPCVLHGFSQSGNTFKVAFLLRALGIAWEPRFVDFMNGVTRTGEWREGLNFATYRFMKAFGPSAPDPAVMAWLRGRLDNAFGIVDKHLSGRTFMVGDAPTIADISLCGYLFYPVEESGYEVTGRFPHIAAWLERVRAMPAWANPYDILPGEIIAPRW